MPSSKVIEAIAVTAELCGRTFTPAAAAVFAGDLDGFPEAAVLGALTRCRKEVKGFMTLQDVVSRIDDGRPGVEQAWAMIPMDEGQSVVWTDEMAAAWGIAAPLLYEGDKIGARMAFKETYAKGVAEARDKLRPAKWTASIGGDVHGRSAALVEAVRLGRISMDHAIVVIGEKYAEGMIRALGVQDHPLLAPPDPKAKARLAALMLQLEMPKP